MLKICHFFAKIIENSMNWEKKSGFLCQPARPLWARGPSHMTVVTIGKAGPGLSYPDPYTYSIRTQAGSHHHITGPTNRLLSHYSASLVRLTHWVNRPRILLVLGCEVSLFSARPEPPIVANPNWELPCFQSVLASLAESWMLSLHCRGFLIYLLNWN